MSQPDQLARIEPDPVTETEPETDVALRLGLLRQMLLIRRFEERVVALYRRAEIPGIAHVSIGQEAVPTGVCSVLERTDYITSTHRGHGHCLAKGARPDRMFAELLGKRDGYCGGRGGSMHIADPATGNLGANAIVGGSIAIAAGAALTAKRLGSAAVSVCFFGDGALNEGLFSETANMAAIWRLPVIFVCENNQYGEYTAAQQVTAGDMVERGRVYGINAASVDGMNVLEVRGAAAAAVERARAGEGPSLLVCSTYRYLGHGMSDPNRPYRTRDEEEGWRKRDAIARLQDKLQAGGVTPDRFDELDASVRQEIDEAVQFAQDSPLPTADAVSEHVYG
jgi:pyruvate dehydrogenase E1 component alpha subunit